MSEEDNKKLFNLIHEMITYAIKNNTISLAHFPEHLTTLEAWDRITNDDSFHAELDIKFIFHEDKVSLKIMDVISGNVRDVE